ncbi:hypothetical protein EJ07DRAFT_128144 [Lizonia empirigonia]|nr:hypothetical protein EJ07DRAFT_128144 [Lizonia empirigonia]
MQVCGGYKSIKYCSQVCQKLDWPIHKLICKTYKDFVASCPVHHHNSLIYFPVNESQSRFVWMRIEGGHYHPSREELTKHNIEIGCPDAEGHVSVKTFDINVALDRSIGSESILFAPPSAAQCCSCCKDKYKANNSLFGVDVELADTLRGPILAWAMRLEDHTTHQSHPIDLGPMGFRHMVDELRLHYNEVVEGYRKLDSENPSFKGITGVRINCQGDQQFFYKPYLEPYVAPRPSLLEQSLLPTPVADRLGMSLHVYKVAPAPIWRDRQLTSRMHNCCSAYLNIFIVMPDDIGSLIVIRKDGVELKPQMIQALLARTASKLESNGHKPLFPSNCLELFSYLITLASRLSKIV